MDNFLQYDNMNISIPKQINHNNYTNNYLNCLNECKKDNNCKSVVITNPKCDKNKTFSECVESINDFDILALGSEKLFKIKCSYINEDNNDNNNVDDKLFELYPSNNNKSFIKNKYANYLYVQNEQIDTTKLYYLKINDKYLGVSNIHNNLFLVDYDNLNDASTFKFEHDGNIIETKTFKCLKTNGKYIILTDCDSNIDEQKFIYENKFDTIRPIKKPNQDLILCLSSISLNTSTNSSNEKIFMNDTMLNEDNRIVLEECKFTQNQKIINEQINNLEMDINISGDEEKNKDLNNNENFKSLSKQIKNKINDIEFCSNPVYKPIVYLILFGIIIYFIWFILRKKYSYNGDETIISTPFKN